jgi:uncharacterized protein YndB with AHSA1/START domain
LRTSIDVTIEVEIARPRLAVWSFLSEVERAPEWLGEFESARQESDGPIGVGTVVRYTVAPGHRSGTYEIVEWDPGHRVAWDGPPLAWGGGTARPRGSFEVFDAGEGHARFVARFQPELTGMQVLLRPYLKRWLRRRRMTDTQTLKAILEANAPS